MNFFTWVDVCILKKYIDSLEDRLEDGFQREEKNS